MFKLRSGSTVLRLTGLQQPFCFAHDLWTRSSGKAVLRLRVSFRVSGGVLGLESFKGFSSASLVAQTVKNLPAMQETWVRPLAWEDPLEEGLANPFQHSCLEDSHGRGDWWAPVHGVAESWTQLSDSAQHRGFSCISSTRLGMTDMAGNDELIEQAGGFFSPLLAVCSLVPAWASSQHGGLWVVGFSQGQLKTPRASVPRAQEGAPRPEAWFRDAHSVLSSVLCWWEQSQNLPKFKKKVLIHRTPSVGRMPHSLCCFYLVFIYLFIWLHQVLLVACEI